MVNEKLEERIRRAVDKGVKARSAYYAAIGLPDEQQLGPPASERQIVALETRLGKLLPPSYRTFLSLHDGWRMINGAMDLLSVREMLEGPRHDHIQKWQQAVLKAGDLVAANSLVIASSEITATKLLLNPETEDAEGEWRVVQHYKGEEYEYENFLGWLEESANGFEELLKEENERSEV